MPGFEIPEGELRWRFDTPGGPGGQHANKTASRAELRFDVSASRAFDGSTKKRIVDRLGTEVRIIEYGSRSQMANRKAAVRRLHAMIDDAASAVAPRRRATRPSQSARERRIKDKRARARTKQQRRKPSLYD